MGEFEGLAGEDSGSGGGIGSWASTGRVDINKTAKVRFIAL
jgi:hypothetical protein